MARPLVRRGRLLSRIRMPLAMGGVAAVVAGFVLNLPGWWGGFTLALLVVGFALYLRVGTPHGPVIALDTPVRGRWMALHSPASHVPSHHVHAWSQTYALDLVADPSDGSRPAFGWWPLARRPEDFPGFGAPVRAPVSGVVVQVQSRSRDHWSRTSPPGVAWTAVESVRELMGPGGVLGNHVVIRRDDGICVLLAHLQRDSLCVALGDLVYAGDVVARCGNSGKSPEPHLHLQVMDGASVWTAAGLPFALFGRELPGNGEHLGEPVPEDVRTRTGRI